MELQEYEKVRSKELLKQVQELEKQILEEYTDFSSTQTHPTDFERDGNPNFKEYLAHSILENEDDLDKLPEKAEALKKLDETITNPIIKKAIVLIIIRNK